MHITCYSHAFILFHAFLRDFFPHNVFTWHQIKGNFQKKNFQNTPIIQQQVGSVLLHVIMYVKTAIKLNTYFFVVYKAREINTLAI